MPATIPLRVLAAVLLVLTGALINTLGAKVAEKTRCFRACGLDKKMSLTKPPQVLNSVLCNRCLRRRSAKHTFVEKTIFQRRKRSTFSDNCPGKVNESTPVPEEQFSSRPFVAIRRYKDTDNWFADVSWDPLNGTQILLCSAFNTTRIVVSVKSINPRVSCRSLQRKPLSNDFQPG